MKQQGLDYTNPTNALYSASVQIKNTVIFFKYIDSRKRKKGIERQTTITTTTTTWRKNIILVVNTPYHR